MDGSTTTSRGHASIESRGGKVILADNSTNGAWVAVESEAAVFLKRKKTVLHGEGATSLDTQPAAHPPHCVRFACR